MFGLVASRVGGAAATRVARTHVVGLCSGTVTRASLGLTSRGFRTSASHAPPYPSVFNVTPERGFLPEKDPLSELPPEYSAMELLLRDMPVQRDAQRAGYLANGTFGHAVHQRLPFYDVSGVEDPELLTALFRDYTFMASAYLLEPCDLLFRTHRHYGLGRDVLPRNIAVPLVTVAEKLRAKPFMEYAMSYALYNWQRVDPKGDLSFKNLQLVRKFHGSASEAGFILVHVAMVAESGNLVRHATDVLSATEQRDVEAFDQAMQEYADCLGRINDVMETMWSRSITHDYNEFRTFIFGIKNQSMFPNLVLYEGCFGDKPVVNVRGESGSNDSIIPTTDNLLQLRFEDNPLTAILRDFRQYRPATHNAWLDEVQVAADKSGVKAFAFSDPNSAVRYLEVLDWNRAFRQRHWGFAKSYILAYSNHPVATGGSPIVTWLPNQLQGVLSAMYECISAIEASDGQLSEENKALLAEIKKRTNAQDRLLAREVEELKRGFDDTRAVDGRSAL